MATEKEVSLFLEALHQNKSEMLRSSILSSEDLNWATNNPFLFILGMRDMIQACKKKQGEKTEVRMKRKNLPKILESVLVGGLIPDRILDGFQKCCIEFSESTKHLVLRLLTIKIPIHFDYVALTGEELGWEESRNPTQVFTDEFCLQWSSLFLPRGHQIGLCSIDDGPYIRQHWLVQPANTEYICAMRPIHTKKDQYGCVWTLKSDKDLKLSISETGQSPGGLIGLDEKILFRYLEL